jgi:hypothetical protein
MEKETLTITLAIWGAFLSSVTFGWNLLRDLTRRGRLRVSCYIGNIIIPGVGTDPNSYLVWSVTNIGKESVVLTHIGGSLPKGMEFMVNTLEPLPKTLQAGENYIGYSNDLSVLSRAKSLWANDSLGRRFKSPWRKLRKMRKQFISGELAKKNG